MKPRLVMVLAVAISLLLVSISCGDGDDKEESSYPAAGEDVFENTTATIEIEITQEGVTTAPGAFGSLETIELQGPTRITRSDPTFEDGSAVVQTEIVEMELTGDSPFGTITVRQSAENPSTGEVRQQNAGEDFPASSFFDVFVEIEVPDMGITATNEDPLRMEATLSDLPPAPGDEYRGANDEPPPIFTPAGQQVGRIIDALHIPEPPTAEAAPTATEEAATPTEPAAQTTDTPEAGGEPQTEGSCEHGVGQSVLFISFTGLEPGQTLTGTVRGVEDAEGGVIGDGMFTVTADADGNATAEVDINQFGPYEWTADGISGSYEVTADCPGPPGTDGTAG